MRQSDEIDLRNDAGHPSENRPPHFMTEGERNFGGRHFKTSVRRSRRRCKVLTFLLVLALIAAAVVLTPNLRSNVSALVAMDHPQGQNGVWRVAFSDDFTGTDLPESRWNRCYPSAEATGCSSRPEEQWYQSNNVNVNGGLLHLTAKKEKANGFEYTSGMVTTGPLEKHAGQDNRFAFKYGYAEARVKVPAGAGLWPAFWLLPADGSGPPEIDALEVLGNDPKTSYATLHWGTDPSNKSMSTINTTDFSDGFHTVGVKWSESSVEWFYDGMRVKRFVGKEQIPHTDMFLLFNLAVGGAWPGSPNAKTAFPADYQVDWVRVWKPITG